MPGVRSARIVANDTFEDAGLRRLRAPAHDAQALTRVLSHESIGGFEVRTLLNEPAHVARLAIEDFFADRHPTDLLLLHVSGHGVKDEAGDLHFATTDTKLRRLASTSVAADFVNRGMSRSRSRRIVLLLDCCYAGAFERGMTARSGSAVGIEEQFGGRGRAVITASSALEYAFEGEELTDAAAPTPSVFTAALVEGLESGDADQDQDGMVALDELYDYVYTKVRETTPNQTPSKWTFGIQGELFIARRARPVTTPTPLPVELQQVLDHPLAGVRMGAVQELTRLANGTHAGLRLAAGLALERLADDDSRTVATEAAAALAAAAISRDGQPQPGASVAQADQQEPTLQPELTPALPASSDIEGAAHATANIALHRFAGQLAVVGAALLVGGLLPAFVWGDSLSSGEPELVLYVVLIAALACGAGVATHWRRLPPAVGGGLLLGVGIASTWGLVALVSLLAWEPSAMRAGFWLALTGHAALAAAAGTAALALARTPEVNLVRRLPPLVTGQLQWLLIVFGIAAAGALVFHDANTWHFAAEASDRWRVVAAMWATPLAIIVPACAAMAMPRRFAVSLLAGWIGGAAAIFLYYQLLLSGLSSREGWDLGGTPITVFGGLLLTLLVTTILLARAKPAR